MGAHSRKRLSIVAGTLIIVLLTRARSHSVAVDTAPATTTEADLGSIALEEVPTPAVTLRAASGATIRFRTQNGKTVEGAPPRRLELPHLVLSRNGALADPSERTLIVEVSGVQVPPPGVTVTLEVTTLHSDPDAVAGSSDAISVWRESHWLSSAGDVRQADATAVFTREFTHTVTSRGDAVASPTDYFRFDTIIGEARTGVASRRYKPVGEDPAFLMENQWIARLPEVQEQSEGAALDELIVHYCDMFPFRKSPSYMNYISTQLRRKEVWPYARTELVPAFIEAFRAQSSGWGFAWDDAWTSFRPETVSGQLSVALTDGMTWFHGKAPVTGHSAISINASAGDAYAAYDTLTDALFSTFHHELFHNLQRSINRTHGGRGPVGGKNGAWHYFSEGTATLASSVGLPGVHFGPALRDRRQALSANRFLASSADGHQRATSDGPGGRLTPDLDWAGYFHAVAYWRFLYEQCGRMGNGREDPAAGMEIIRQVLSALYSGSVVNIATSTEVAEHLPGIVDLALANTPSCPFRTFDDSLTRFSWAVYALRIQGGRCQAPGEPAGCGFYDPNGLYVDPPVSPITYTRAGTQTTLTIGSSFDLAFLDVIEAPGADGSPLTIRIEGVQDAGTRFAVQLWELVDSGPGTRPKSAAPPLMLGIASGAVQLVHYVPYADATETRRLALIITRVDASGDTNPRAEFTVRLRPGGDA